MYMCVLKFNDISHVHTLYGRLVYTQLSDKCIEDIINLFIYEFTGDTLIGYIHVER